MKRIIAVFLATTTALAVQAQTTPLPVGLHQAEDNSDIVYTGPGWATVIDGDYSYMQSSLTGDMLELEFSGAAIILFRDMSDTAADVEICLDSVCETVGNYSSTFQARVPVGYLATGDDDPHTLTISNLADAPFQIDSLLIIDSESPQLVQAQTTSPATEYLTLDSGRIVAIDYSISAGEIAQIIFLALLSALTMFSIVLKRVSHD